MNNELKQSEELEQRANNKNNPELRKNLNADEYIKSKIDTSFEKLLKSKIKINKSSKIDETKILLYVKNPKIKENTLISYYTYTLSGKLLPMELERSYSDFFALRLKLVERWPGIYIPVLPESHLIKKKSLEFILKLLNNFCFKIANTFYLINCEEVALFLSNTNNVANKISNLQELSFNEGLNRYQNAIIAKEGEDILKIINDNRLNEEYQIINDSLKNTQNFKEYAIQVQKAKENEIKNYINLIKIFENYEENSLSKWSDKGENNLILTNRANLRLEKAIDNIKFRLINPYNEIIQELELDELDLNSMKESFDSLYKLKKELEFLISQNKNLNENIEKRNDVSDVEVKYLEEVVKLASLMIMKSVDEFKIEKMINYYNNLNNFKEENRSNQKISLELWEEIRKSSKIE